MKRRLFFGLVWASLTVWFGLLAARSGFDDVAVTLGYAIVTVLYGILAVYTQFHPQPMDDPDDPAPRHWFELAGLVGATLLVSAAILFVSLG